MTQLTVTASEHEAIELAAQRMRTAIRPGQPAHLALAGGNTPRPAYALLAEQVENWTGVELWLGDERMVPATDPQSNAAMIEQSLVAQVKGGPPLLQTVKTELTAEHAADDYGQRLSARLEHGADHPPVLDLSLLGLGEDGHTASLFPHAPALRDASSVCVAVHDSPKPPPDRVTLTLPIFAAARNLVMLATGAGKADAVAAMLAEPDEAVPASLLARERLELIVDAAAATRVPAGRRP